jgi:MSHA biogenesis protein MshJ
VSKVWQQWIQRLDALSERERVLIFVAGLALVLTAAFLAGIEPGLKQRRVLGARLIDQQAQQIAADAQKQALARALAQDPDAQIREQIEGKQRELAALDTQLAALQRTLIGPERMAMVLEQLIGPERGVRLVSLRNLPAPLVGRRRGFRGGKGSPGTEDRRPRTFTSTVWKWWSRAATRACSPTLRGSSTSRGRCTGARPC